MTDARYPTRSDLLNWPQKTESKIPHHGDLLRRTICVLVRDKTLIEQCREIPTSEVRNLVAASLKANAVPVHNVRVRELPYGQECKYALSYTLDVGKERQVQRFFRRSVSAASLFARQARA